MDLDDQERAAKFIKKQIEKAAKEGKEVTEAEFTDLKRESEEKITLSLGIGKTKPSEVPSTSGLVLVCNL